MKTTGLQFSLTAMLGLVACAAVNFWLFRVGFLWGLVGLNVTKHLGVAILCQALGVNRPHRPDRSTTIIPPPHTRLSGSP